MHDIIIDINGEPFLLPAAMWQIFLASLLGFIIGMERALHGKIATLRTFSTICAGSCLFTMLSVEAAKSGGAAAHDVTRVAAQIVTGIGFLGGGVIFKSQDRIEGITTGAMIWFAAAIGMGCGFNQIGIVLCSFGIFFMFYTVSALVYPIIGKPKSYLNEKAINGDADS